MSDKFVLHDGAARRNAFSVLRSLSDLHLLRLQAQARARDACTDGHAHVVEAAHLRRLELSVLDELRQVFQREVEL